MPKKKKTVFLILWLLLTVVTIVGSLIVKAPDMEHESIKVAMQDAVLHEENQMLLLGMRVNPAVMSAFSVTGILLVFALLVRILVIPRFKEIPGRFQLLLEQWVGLFKGLAESNSPHRNHFLGAYVFTAGTYIFVSTIFELFGAQGVTSGGLSMSLPAPLSDINAAIAMGVMSYCAILTGGIASNGLLGVGLTLKEFSLPISMSFRLFGAMLSGLLVTELVYYYLMLSFVLPVFVGVMFTLLHALIQAYVLTMLTAQFYGEVAEPHEKKEKKQKKRKPKKAPTAA